MKKITHVDTVEIQTKHYTTIDDKKPDIEIVQDVVHDVELVIDWWYHSDKSKDDITELMKNISCKNTLHGLQILKKIVSIDGIKVNDDFMFGVILHDVVKYKKRVAVINGIMDHYLGVGRWVDTRDHGINAGYLLSAIFENLSIKTFNFVFMHAKDHPYQIDPDSWSDCELAFFIIDDLIRDVKKYKTKLNKSEFDIVHKYYQHPELSNTRIVFNILKECNQSSKK